MTAASICMSAIYAASWARPVMEASESRPFAVLVTSIALAARGPDALIHGTAPVGRNSKVHVTATCSSNREITVSVKDSGVGIAA